MIRFEHKLHMFENKVLRKIFELKKDVSNLGYYTINYTSSEEMGGKYETITGHLA
jgi:hypothetical protein